jgi:hypothetical protein
MAALFYGLCAAGNLFVPAPPGLPAITDAASRRDFKGGALGQVLSVCIGVHRWPIPFLLSSERPQGIRKPPINTDTRR